MGEIELLRLFALADEFKYMVVREVGVTLAGASWAPAFLSHLRVARCCPLIPPLRAAASRSLA